MIKIFLFLFFSFSLATSHIITVGVTTLPIPADIPGSRSVNKSQVMRQVYESLFTIDEFGKLRSSFFKKWDYNKRTTSYTFTLGDSVKFSDGSKVQSVDLIKTLKRGFEGEFNFTNLIEAIDSLDSTRIIIKLKKEDSSLLIKLTDLIFTVLKEPSSASLFPIGTGVFKIADANLKQIRLLRNSFHKNFKIGNITQINYILIENSILTEREITNNNLNFFPFFHISETANILKKFKRVVYTSHRIATLVLNIKDLGIRSAVASCIDTNELINLPYFKFDTHSYSSILPSGIENYQSSLPRPSFDIKRCSQMIKKIGNKKLIWLNTYNSSQDLIFLNQIVNRINIAAGFDLISIKTLTLNDAQASIFRGEYDIFMCSISPPIPLVDRLFSDFIFSKENPNSLIKYSDKEVISKFTELQKHEYNNRTKYISAVEAALINRNWVIPIGRKVTTFYIPKEWTGVENLNGMNGNFYLGKITIHD